jgi:chloramphenicol 3-O phosphotransferase
MDPTLIILNGASSAGKTALANAFQKLEDTPFLYAGIDTFMHMLPDRWIGDHPDGIQLLPFQDGWGHWCIDVKFGPVAEKLLLGYRDSILALLKAGNNVITDVIISREQDLKAIVDAFGELRTFLVAVYAPLEVLEGREMQRGEPKGLSRGRYEAVYSQKIKYDLLIDTTTATPQQGAEQIQRLIRSGRS